MNNRKSNLGEKVIAMIIALALVILGVLLLCFGIFTGEFVHYHVSFAENKISFIFIVLCHITIIYLFFSIFKDNYNYIKNKKTKENLFLATVIYITIFLSKILLVLVIFFTFIVLLGWLKREGLF